MKNHLVKYAVSAGLAFLMALPALAHSLSNAAPGSGFAATGAESTNTGQMGELGPQSRQGRVGRAPERVTGYAGRRSAAPRRHGNFDDARGGGFAAGIGGRRSRPSLAGRALARADQIGLTAEQRDQIGAARRAAREASINRRAATQIAGLELRDLMAAEPRDIAAIETKLREIGEQRIAEQTGALRLDEAVNETLTDEQLEELGDRARDRRRDRRGGRGGRGRQDAGR